jgi:hypothetical protein
MVHNPVTWRQGPISCVWHDQATGIGAGMNSHLTTKIRRLNVTVAGREQLVLQVHTGGKPTYAAVLEVELPLL